MKLSRSFGLAWVSTLLATLAPLATAQDAVTILHDQFASTGANAGLVNDENGFRTPTATQAAYATFGTGNFAYVQDTSLGISGGTNRGILAYFTPSTSHVSLDVGESISARIAFRLTGSIASNVANSNLRFGLLYSGGGATNLSNAPTRLAGGVSSESGTTGGVTNSLTGGGSANTSRHYSGYVASATAAEAAPPADAVSFWYRLPAAVSGGGSGTIVGPTGSTLPGSADTTFFPVGSAGGGTIGTFVSDEIYTARFTVTRVSADDVTLTFIVTDADGTIMQHTVTGAAQQPELRFDSLMFFSISGAAPHIHDLLIEHAQVEPTITAQPQSHVAVSGDDVSFSVTAISAATLSYQWFKDDVALTNGNGITGATSATLSLENVQLNQAGNYTVVVSTSAGEVTSEIAVLTVNAAPEPVVFDTQPQSATIDQGDDVAFSVTVSGTPPFTYQWQKGGVDLVDEPGHIAGATTATLSLTNAALADAGSYTVAVTNIVGTYSSAAATLTVIAPTPPSVTTQPEDQTIFVSETATFTVVASGTAPLAYQWRKGGVDLVDAADHIAGATTATLTISNAVLADDGEYTVFVSNLGGSTTSNAARLIVQAPVAPTITTPPASQTVTVGDEATFSVTATGTAPLAYQWRKNGDDIDGAIASTFTIPAAQQADAGEYTVRVSNSVDAVISAPATLVVNLPTTGPAAPVGQPATEVGPSGFAPESGLIHTGFTAHWDAAPGIIVGYHLDVSTSPDFATFVPGYENRSVGNVTSFFVSGLSPNTTYYYRVRADNGLVGENSNAVSVTTPGVDSFVILHDEFTATGANAGLVADANGFLAPTRTQAAYASFGTANFSYSTSAPTNLGLSAGGTRGIMTYFTPSNSTVSLAVGESLRATVHFRLVAGTPNDVAGNMRWGLLNSGGNGTANNLPGLSARYLQGASNSLNSMPTGNSARGYSGYVVSTRASLTGATDSIGFWRRVAATESSGINDTTTQILGPTGNDIVSTSAFRPLGSYGGGAAGALLNSSTTNINDAPEYVMTFVVTRTGEAAVDLTFVVSHEGNVVMSHTATQTSDVVTSFDSLMLFSLYGPSPRYTDVLIEKVASAPQILAQPADDVALVGESSVLSVVAIGEQPLAYQWKKDGVDLVDGAGIAGAQSATLTLGNLQLTQSGNYTVTVTNAEGTITSAAAELLVITEPIAPVITVQPADVTVDQGGEVRLAVTATGIPAPRYQWQRNGVDVVNVPDRISGATSAELVISPALAADSGTYTVIVSNMAADVVSRDVAVTVIPPTPPTISAQPQSQTATTGGSVTFSVTATGTEPITYQWQFNGVDIPGATSPSYTIRQVRSSHAGNYTVVLTNIAATVTSDAATLTALAPTAIPATPVAVAATTYWEGDFTANWNPASGAEGYRLDVATNSTFTTFVPGFQNRDVGTSLSRLVPDLAPNTTYYYRVRAYNSFGTTISSNVISVTTAPLMQELERDIDLAGMTWLSTRPNDNIVTAEPAEGTVSFRMQGTSAPTFVGFLPQAIALQIGQRMTMTLTFETGATVNAVTSNSFRIGLFNSNSTRMAVSSNVGDSDPTFRDDRGYMISMNFNGSDATLHGRRASVELADNNLLGTTTDLWSPSLVNADLTSGTPGPFAPWTTYTLSISIARQTDRTVVSALLQGGANNNYFITGEDLSSGSLINSVYDQFGMRINGSSTAISQLLFTDLQFSVETFEQPSAPRVATHAASRTIVEGQSTTFTVAASGATPMSFQWLKDGEPIADGGRFSGTTTASLTLTGAVLADAGAYSVLITNSLGAEVSDPAILTVTEAVAPVITAGPANRTVTEGEPVSFTVVHSGTTPFTYQWSLNGTPLTDDARYSGTAEATLNVIAADLAEAGTYAVTVANVKGSDSASATLVVNAAPSAPSAPVATAATDVQAARMTANWNRSQHATGYLLYVSTDADFSTLISGAQPIDVEASNSWTLNGLLADTLYYYRVRAYNSVGTSDYSATITTLVQRNEAPLILSPNSTVFTAGIPSSFRVRVEGAPAPTITATGLPAWAQLHASTGLLTGTAPVGTTGDFTFQITAANGNPPNATQSFTISVTPIPAITASITVGTLAGTGGQAGALNATGAAARFRGPLAVVSDAAGNAYVADADNHVIRRITPAGVVTTFAGEMGSAGSADGTGAAARFNAPTGLAIDAQGNLYVADTLNHTIRRITSAGVVTTIAGTAGESGSLNGTGAAARFNGPQGVALSGTTLYVADTNNHLVRQIALSNNAVTTRAGAAGESGAVDGSASVARFSGPTGIAVAGTSVYVTDIDSHTVRAISASGQVVTVAGYPEATAAADGVGANARFRQPSGLVASPDGSTLYLTDTENHTVRRLVIGSRAVTTGAGLAGAAGTANGVGAAARFNGPAGIGLAPNGDLLIADTENHTVRTGTLPVAPQITQEPQTVTVAAGGSATFTVVATGTPAPTYQWFLNGNPIAGATSATYSVSNVNSQTHGGAYTVVVSNTLRSATSQQAYLIIPIAPTTDPSTGGGGGGGAPSLWFLGAIALLATARGLIRRRSE